MDTLNYLKKKIIDDLYQDWFLSLTELQRLYVGLITIGAISLVSYIFV